MGPAPISDQPPRRWYAGLFGYVGPGAHVRNVGLTAPNSDSGVRAKIYVGALAGASERARISGVYSDVDVAALLRAGGLVGFNWRHGFVIESYATGDVTGSQEVGGLVGTLKYSNVAASYATGDVTLTTDERISDGCYAGGLVGLRFSGHVRATYATGSVTSSNEDWCGHRRADHQVAKRPWVGGLIGWVATPGTDWPRANYAIGQVSAPESAGQTGGLTGGCNRHYRQREDVASYWDTETAGQATSFGCSVGYTTAQLQAPTGYTGIYANWNVDVDVGGGDGAFDGPGDDPWDFGTSSQYPVLKYCAAKPGIDTADGDPYCPLQPANQRAGLTVTLEDSHVGTQDPGSDADVEQPSADQQPADDVVSEGYTVDAQVVADVKSWAAETHQGAEHVSRWQRVLVAFGALDADGVSGGAMSAAEAQGYADWGWQRWVRVVAELTALEASQQDAVVTQRDAVVTPEVSVTAGSAVVEGGDAAFTVTASPAPAAGLEVTVTVSASGDYGAATGQQTVTVPASGSVTLTVGTTDDDADETDGSVTATVNAGSDYTVSATQGAATVAVADDDDDVDAGYTVDPQVVADVKSWAAETHQGAEHVSRWQRVLVAFGALDADGVSGGAMSAAEAQGYADWGWQRWVRVVAELTALEASQRDAVVTPEVSVTAGSAVVEGGDAAFTVTASPAPAAGLEVTVTVSASGDYGAATGQQTVTVPASGSVTLTVGTTDDDADETDGSVTATVNAGSDYTVSSSQGAATVAVADDDVPEISVSAGSGVSEGGDAAFTVTASPAPAAGLEVTVTVSASGDYGAATGQQTVTVPASGSVTLTVGTTDDDADETDGSVTATVDAGSGYTVSSAAAAATVAVADDDDPPPVVSIAAVGDVTEGAAARFTVSASRAPVADLAVSVSIAARGDFGVAAGPRTVTVAAGTTSVALSVATAGDDADEADGSVSVSLDAAAADAGYTVSDTADTATVAVSDDDDPPPPPVVDPPVVDVPVLGVCSGLPGMSVGDAAVSRSAASVEFVIGLDCEPARAVTAYYVIVRDGRITGGTKTVTLTSAEPTAAVTVSVDGAGTLAVHVVYATGAKNYAAKGALTYTD